MSTATQVKTRPILFSAPMVKAILDGRKTQTRRIVKPPAWWDGMTHYATGNVDENNLTRTEMVLTERTAEHWQYCPLASPGCRLWVREAWAANAFLNLKKPSELEGETIYYRASYDNDSHFVWRPSIYMPRWASRITLEVTGVRVERVESCSTEDAICEGFDSFAEFLDVFYALNAGRVGVLDNPWVWCLDFRRVEP